MNMSMTRRAICACLGPAERLAKSSYAISLHKRGFRMRAYDVAGNTGFPHLVSGYCSPRHRMPYNSRSEGSERACRRRRVLVVYSHPHRAHLLSFAPSVWWRKLN